MDLELKGRRALVTASSNGIGLEIARALAAEGAQVVINGRTKTIGLAPGKYRTGQHHRRPVSVGMPARAGKRSSDMKSLFRWSRREDGHGGVTEAGAA